MFLQPHGLLFVSFNTRMAMKYYLIESSTIKEQLTLRIANVLSEADSVDVN